MEFEKKFPITVIVPGIQAFFYAVIKLTIFYELNCCYNTCFLRNKCIGCAVNLSAIPSHRIKSQWLSGPHKRYRIDTTKTGQLGYQPWRQPFSARQNKKSPPQEGSHTPPGWQPGRAAKLVSVSPPRLVDAGGERHKTTAVFCFLAATG